MKTRDQRQEQLRDFGELFDEPKRKWPNEDTISTCAVCGKIRPLKESCDCNDTTFADFDGVTYEPKFDATRLRGEMARVYWVMNDLKWHTLGEIATAIYYQFEHKVDSEAGISARLRDLRKAKFGSHTVNRRRRGEASRGIWEYQLL